MPKGKTQKECKGCHQTKLITHFYAAGNSYQSRCKPCHNIHRKTYYKKKQRVTKNGFTKLLESTQDEIKEDIKTMSMVKISKKYNLNVHALRSWKRRNQII